jgi:hypothetical protein
MLKEKKNINYPIKYAVLELKSRGGWLVGFRDITQGFIASKCYVVETNIVYHQDGSHSITHKVVFPYEDIDCLKSSLQYGRKNIGEEQIPSYDACDHPYPVNIVGDLFDSYEEAKKYAEAKNEAYKRNLITNVSMLDENWQDKFESLIQQYNNSLEICYMFETIALDKTADMLITESKDEPPMIRVLRPPMKERE